MDAGLTIGVAITSTAAAVVMRRGPSEVGAILNCEVMGIDTARAELDGDFACAELIEAVVRTHVVATRHGYRILGVGILGVGENVPAIALVVKALTQAGLGNVIAVAPRIPMGTMAGVPASAAADENFARKSDLATLAAAACNAAGRPPPQPTGRVAADAKGRHHRRGASGRHPWLSVNSLPVIAACAAIVLAVVTLTVGVDVSANEQGGSPSVTTKREAPPYIFQRPRPSIGRAAPNVSKVAPPATQKEMVTVAEPATSAAEPAATIATEPVAPSTNPPVLSAAAVDVPTPSTDPTPPPTQNAPPEPPETTAPQATPHLPGDSATPPSPGPTN